MPLAATAPDSSSSPSRCPPDVWVAVVLGDALHRVAVLGGREGMSRSLGSVFGGIVTRFLGGGLRGVPSRVIATPGVRSVGNGIALSADGSTLLVSDRLGGSHAIHEFSVADGSRRRVVGSKGDGPLQFEEPMGVHIAPDGFVFVAEWDNYRVQVLTPSLDFHAFVPVRRTSSPLDSGYHVNGPVGVCANADVVVVSVTDDGCVSVYNCALSPVPRNTDPSDARSDCASWLVIVASPSPSLSTTV